jgi:hypothetical protein
MSIKLINLLEISINIIVNKLIMWPFYYPIIFSMKRVGASKRVKYNGITLLALNIGRFRGDLEVLANLGFRVYLMPYSWQTRIFYAYKDRDLKDKFMMPEAGSGIFKDRIRVIKYLSSLMRLLVQKKEINCVISAGLFYNQDFDWGAATKNIGVPYIVFHRENLVVSKHLYMHYVNKAKFLNKIGFIGTSIVFQNKVVKSIFDKYSGVNSENIFALGSLRMDDYIDKVRSNKNLKKNNRITLFSFPSSNAILSGHYNDNFGWYKLHDKVHTSFVELAIENPGIDFVIKHKGVNWSKTKFLLENLDAYNIRNLYIYDLSYDSQKLILTSDVVTGFCSTSLLEAAIAEKPVIYPLFSEAADEQYRDFVCFDNASNIFDIATNSKDFKKIIIEKYNKPEISKKSKELRVLQFEEQVSSIVSNASSEYSKILKDACI